MADIVYQTNDIRARYYPGPYGAQRVLLEARGHRGVWSSLEMDRADFEGLCVSIAAHAGPPFLQPERPPPST